MKHSLKKTTSSVSEQFDHSPIPKHNSVLVEKMKNKTSFFLLKRTAQHLPLSASQSVCYGLMYYQLPKLQQSLLFLTGICLLQQLLLNLLFFKYFFKK